MCWNGCWKRPGISKDGITITWYKALVPHARTVIPAAGCGAAQVVSTGAAAAAVPGAIARSQVCKAEREQTSGAPV